MDASAVPNEKDWFRDMKKINIVIGKWNWPQSDSFQENPIAKKCRLLSRIPSPLKEENFKTATKYALQL